MVSKFSNLYQRRLPIACLSALVALLAGANERVLAQSEVRVVASDGLQLDQMGYSAAVSGDLMVLGAPYGDTALGVNAGAVYAFRRNASGWIQIQKLIPSDSRASQNFGYSVSIEGNVLVVGARGDTDLGASAGAAYVFRYNGSNWIQEQKLHASDGVLYGYFGCSSAVSGSTIVVGSSNVGPGAAYVFRFNGANWPEERKLVAPDGTSGDRFGISVAVSGNVAVIGAELDRETNQPTGSAYVFRRNGTTWLQDGAKLRGANAAGTYTMFGHAVSVSGDLALVGDYASDDRGIEAGSVYVFRFNGSSTNPQWNQEAELYAADSAASDWFGYSVAAGLNEVVIGAPNYGRSTASTSDGFGSVYKFQKNGSSWAQVDQVTASDGLNYDSLGTSVAISGTDFLGGAPGHNGGAKKGAGYVFASGGGGGCVANSDCPSDNNVCTTETCVSGQCQTVNNTLPCNDNLFCNGTDTCNNGVCLHSGNPCPGADGDVNCMESCNETSDNCAANDPNGSPCNDGLYCNGADQCSNGSCGIHLGNPCPGADGDSNCRESCYEAGDNCTASDLNGSVCNDGNALTTNDRCTTGVCAGTTSGCVSNADCNDNNPCTTDTCVSGVCQRPNNTAACTDDGNACTNDVCSGGACTHPAKANGTVCSDGLYCNGADSCSAGQCGVHAGNPCPGADGDSDCSETCNETADACTTNDPNGSVCNDGNSLTTNDRCTTGVCAGTTSGCTSNAACNDNNPCTTDTCVGGVCQRPNNTAACTDDGNPCTNDVCSGGACTHPVKANGTVCSDGLYCNGADTCSSGVCSVHAGNPCPGADGDVDCSEACNETSDACIASDPNGTACNDGNSATFSDQCSSGVCIGTACRARGQSCSQNFQCCSNSCNTNSGNCK